MQDSISVAKPPDMINGYYTTPDQAAEPILSITAARTFAVARTWKNFGVMDWVDPKPDFTEHDLSTFEYEAVQRTELSVAFMWKSDVDKVHKSLQTFSPAQVNHRQQYPGRELLRGRGGCCSRLRSDHDHEVEEKAEMEVQMAMETSLGAGMVIYSKVLFAALLSSFPSEIRAKQSVPGLADAAEKARAACGRRLLDVFISSLPLIPQPLHVTEKYCRACGRAAGVFDEQASRVSDLPFTRDTWQSIAKLFHVHRNITRTILRDIAHFSSVRHTPKSSRAPEICELTKLTTYSPSMHANPHYERPS
jgi:hypothetical protein